MNRRNSLKAVRPFDESRDSTERTDPDYAEKRISRMARELLSLPQKDRGPYYGGLEREDIKALRELFSNLRSFRPVSELLHESRRCINKADAPHGSVAVTGKALDLLIKSFFPDLKGTLGKMLHQVKKRDRSSAEVAQIIDDLVPHIENLAVRNAGAHFISSRPEISLREAKEFLDQVQLLLKYEEEQSRMIFLHLLGD